MFIEFTADKEKVLINPEHVSLVRTWDAKYTTICLHGGDIKVHVDQDFEETKKRLGLRISPRAETLAVP